MALETEVVTSLDAAEKLAPEWDGLAERLSLPYCSPSWLLPWFRHVAPEGAELRIVAVRDGEELAALAPFYAQRRRGAWTYLLLATDVTSRVEPLVRPDLAEDATRALTAALAAARPAPAIVQLTGVPAASQWGERLRAAWPSGAPTVHRRAIDSAPTVAIEADDLDAWLAQRSSNFRGQMRRFRRKLDDAGAEYRTTDRPEDATADLRELERLHRGRRAERGGTSAFPPGALEMLADAGRELIPKGRFRLATIAIDGRPIAAQLFVAAGSELTYWNGGFDDEYGQLRPAYIALVDAVGAAIAGGMGRLDLGIGTQDYKYRFATGEDELEDVTIVPAGLRGLAGRASQAPERARHALESRLSPERKEWLKQRLPGRRGIRRATARSRRGGAP